MGPDRYVMPPAVQALLADLGVPLPRLLRRAGLPEGRFRTFPVTLNAGDYYAFWQALDDEVADPLLPLRIGRLISAEMFDPPLFAAFCSPTLTAAASRVATYKPLIGPMRLTVDVPGPGLVIGTEWPEGTEGQTPPAVLVLTELVFWLTLARIATRTDLPAQSVRASPPLSSSSLSSPPLSSTVRDAYRDFFGTSVEPSSGPSTAAISFFARDAERPFLTANERMWEFFEPELRRQLGDLGAGATTAELARAALVRLLPGGSGTMRAVAAELAVSPRTLQRRLEAEATSFQAVLRSTREALAQNYLRQPRLSTGDIAYLLGYDDTNSFYRAFRSWTATTPEKARLRTRVDQ